MYRWATISLLGFLAPMPAAALDWAIWSDPVAGSSTGSFASGETVELVALIESGFAAAAGSDYTSEPAIPGTIGNGNPPFTRMLTGPVQSTINADDVIATLDLSGISVDSNTTFGLADQRSGRQYRLELRDAAHDLLPLTGVQVTPYDITYIGSGLIADYSTLLIDDLLLVNSVHDAGGFYIHTGLTTFSNLPTATRSIWLFSNIFQDAEGIQIALAITAPAPSPVWMGSASFLSLAVLCSARRRRGCVSAPAVSET